MLSPTELPIALDGRGASDAASALDASRASTTALVYRATRGGPVEPGEVTFILAHGAGAGQRHPFLVGFATGLASAGIDVVTFDFPYKAQGRRMPDRAPVLEACYRTVISAVRQELDSATRHLFIGGKSMGGRMATHVAARDPDLPIDGLVLLGYPLHPPALPLKLRADHLPGVGRPMLFVQGTRDGFGTPAELEAVVRGISPDPTIHEVQGGDHSFKVPRRGAPPQEDVYADVQRTIVEWVKSVIGSAAARGS